MSDNNATVEMHDVGKWYGGHRVFEHITLTVHPREVVAIIGPSGTGKSTLIRCLNQLTPFETGRIRVVGQELFGTRSGQRPSRAVLQTIRTQVGMVFQNFNLFHHMTVLDNLTVGPREVKHLPRAQAEARAQELLAMVGLAHKAAMYPRRLSGGEQQRVAICRALAMDPQLMLLDEPTSALDPELVGDVLAAIQSLAQHGMTMILVTHEMLFAKEVADRVVVMADGAIVEQGPARQILEHPQTARVQAFLDRVRRHTAPLPPWGVEEEFS